jgi:hypothetical protein
MFRQRPSWIRGLRLYDGGPDVATTELHVSVDADVGDERVHARSLFRSLDDPNRFALYSLHDIDSPRPGQRRGPLAGIAPGDHTLMVVREFRRVPLFASALGLVLFMARYGYAAPVAAALAHFAERAVSLYQPAYLLLAHSLEEPQVTVLLTGVYDGEALEAARAAAFSIEQFLPELRPMLIDEPELYVYCPDPEIETRSMVVSRHAV